MPFQRTDTFGIVIRGIVITIILKISVERDEYILLSFRSARYIYNTVQSFGFFFNYGQNVVQDTDSEI